MKLKTVILKSLLLCFLVAFTGLGEISAQHKITVSKRDTLAGFYMNQAGKKSFEYIFFSGNGEVVVFNTSMKKKKAIGQILACLDGSCGLAKKTEYEKKESLIEFSFSRKTKSGRYLLTFDGSISKDKELLTLKKGETGKILEVKEYVRVKKY